MISNHRESEERVLLKPRFKTYMTGLFLAVFFLALGPFRLYADPYANVTSDMPLYQRVQKLGEQGLLDPRDKAVLDEGKIVSRLELALYIEKSASNLLSSPPVDETPAPQSAPLKLSSNNKFETDAKLDMSFPQNNPDTKKWLAQSSTSGSSGITRAARAELRREIRELLQELGVEAAYLRSHTSLQGARLSGQEDELEKLRPIQDELDKV